MLAMLGARYAPVFAIDVPDHALIEMEKLAVTAWSARDNVTNRRGRMIVAEAAMQKLVASGTRMITASAAAILVVVCVSVPLLLERRGHRPRPHRRAVPGRSSPARPS